MASLQGQITSAGEVVLRPNHGLDRQRELVRCTYDSPRFGPGTVAFLLIP